MSGIAGLTEKSGRLGPGGPVPGAAILAFTGFIMRLVRVPTYPTDNMRSGRSSRWMSALHCMLWASFICVSYARKIMLSCVGSERLGKTGLGRVWLRERDGAACGFVVN